MGGALLHTAALSLVGHTGRRRVVRDLAGLGPVLGRVGTLEVRLATTKRDIRKAQRLRYRVFFEEGGAIADARTARRRRDVCPFDAVCDHLVVVDLAARGRTGRPKLRIVGCYRLLRQEVAEAHFGFYAQQEFDVAPLIARHPDARFLELGRSCVHRDYRSKRTIDLLWCGIWAYATHHRITCLIGCASLPGTDPNRLALPLSYLAAHARAPEGWSATAHAGRGVAMGAMVAGTFDARRGFAALPPLLKGYLRVGAMIGDGAVVDRQFGTTDVLVVTRVAAIDPRYIAHARGHELCKSGAAAAAVHGRAA